MCDAKEDHMDMPKDHYTSRLDLTTYTIQIRSELQTQLNAMI